MIIQTTKEINGVMYSYAYSDSGFMIERDGVRYSEAVDPLDSGRVYMETDEPIDIGTGEAIVQEWDALEAPPHDLTPEERLAAMESAMLAPMGGAEDV